jgi:hypothetical protein
MKLGLQAFDPLRKQHTGEPVYNDWRFMHTWVIGKSGVGKSTAMERMALDDIERGEGVAFFDPFGNATQNLLARIPESRWDDVVLFDPSDLLMPVAFNILDGVREDDEPQVASSVVDAVHSMWQFDVPTSNMDVFFYTTVAALLNVPKSTLLGIHYLINSEKYRKHVVGHVDNAILKDIWETWYEDIPDRDTRQLTMSTVNKMITLIIDPKIANIIGQPKSKLDIGEVLRRNKILVVCVPEGKLGREKSSLLGALVLARINTEARRRKGNEPPFRIYLDEGHRFGRSVLADMLSGIRQFGVSLTIAHQYVRQLTPELQAALKGTVGTVVSFRIGVDDAREIGSEFRLTKNDADDTTFEPYTALTDLPPYKAFARTPYETWLLDMPQTERRPNPKAPMEIRSRSRKKYGRPRRRVEAEIAAFVEGT